MLMPHNALPADHPTCYVFAKATKAAMHKIWDLRFLSKLQMTLYKPY